MMLFLSRKGLVAAVIHAALIIISYLGAFLMRYDFRIPLEGYDSLIQTLPFLLAVRLIAFGYFHLFERLWRYFGMRDILAIFKAGTASSLVFGVGMGIFSGGNFLVSILFLDWLFCLALMGGLRLTLRGLSELNRKPPKRARVKALIVGAGDGGEMLLREIERNPKLHYEVVGFVDDAPKKQGKRIHGVQVVGPVERLPQLCLSRSIQEILVAIPSTTFDQKRRIMEKCRASGISFKTIPPLRELLDGNAGIGQLRDVGAEELLGRDTVQLDLDRIRRELQGKRVLVTGAAGSIGSELCRQIAVFDPEMILLFDRAESNLFFIDRELRDFYPAVRTVPIVGDVLDRMRVEEIVQAYSPQFIYHAAAYKHVPLVEDHPLEGIRNNVFGTEVVGIAAQKYGVNKFILISTDKAVSPISIMGMTKRVSECLLKKFSEERTQFVVVRFGNVLGSDGSVLPLFKWQIARGGPLTVTDPEATRYFMLISEAAQLVLEAGMIGRGGEIFFLDMGEPVKIVDLAHNLIRLSGLKPGRDIGVEIVGLRPGERLKEALLTVHDEIVSTDNEKVYMVQNGHFDLNGFREDLERLRKFMLECDRKRAVEQLKVMADNY